MGKNPQELTIFYAAPGSGLDIFMFIIPVHPLKNPDINALLGLTDR